MSNSQIEKNAGATFESLVSSLNINGHAFSFNANFLISRNSKGNVLADESSIPVLPNSKLKPSFPKFFTIASKLLNLASSEMCFCVFERVWKYKYNRMSFSLQCRFWWYIVPTKLPSQPRRRIFDRHIWSGKSQHQLEFVKNIPSEFIILGFLRPIGPN